MSFPRKRAGFPNAMNRVWAPQSSPSGGFLDPCFRRGDKSVLHAPHSVRGSNEVVRGRTTYQYYESWSLTGKNLGIFLLTKSRADDLIGDYEA
jgi:hypothetical protein